MKTISNTGYVLKANERNIHMNDRFFKMFNRICVVLVITMFAWCSCNPSYAVELDSVPKIYVTTDDNIGNNLWKANGYVTASIQIKEDSAAEINDRGQIKVRGNSTAHVEKRPYTIKFDKKTDVFGMGAAKKWVLLANCFDPTLMRNYLAFHMADYLGLDYTSEFQYVDLYLDGVYKGNYLLTESVETGNSRVDIDAGKGDFLIEYEDDRVEDDTTYISTPKYKLRFVMHDPETLSEIQQASILEKLNIVETAMDSGDFKEICQVIDMDSFVDFYILNEYFKTMDVGYSSVYFYYKDGILYAGPAWDFDLSSGNVNPGNAESYKQYCNGSTPENSYSGIWFKTIWMKKLLEYDEFNQLVSYRFKSIQEYIENIYKPNGLMDSVQKKFSTTFNGNFTTAKWDVGKAYTPLMRIPDSTYEGNVAFLRKWFENRNNWLSDNWHINDVTLNYFGYYNAIAAAEEYSPSSYYNYDLLEDALSDRELYTQDVTQADINEATEAIWKAIGQLKKKVKTDLTRFDFESGETDKDLETGITTYHAHNGVFADNSTLSASVNGTEPIGLIYSSAEYADGDKTDITVPVMTASKSAPWGENLYYEIKCSTTGYENVTFTASLGATKKGPRDFKLQYSLDGKAYTDIAASQTSLSNNKVMQKLYSDFELPEECADHDVIYIRIIVASDTTVAGESLFGTTGGELAINHVCVQGAKIGQVYEEPETVAVTGITLTPTNLNMKVGDKAALIAVVNPFDATNKNITWSSSDTSVADVSNGIVTAKSTGTTTIRVMTADGDKTADCTITVTAKASNPGENGTPDNNSTTEANINKSDNNATNGNNNNSGNNTTNGNNNNSGNTDIKIGTTFSIGNFKYKITSTASGNNTVELIAPVKKTLKKASVPATVKYAGITFKVTSIAKNAFKNNKKLTSVTIGKNITKIGSKAFYGCKKLKTATVKTSNLKSVGKQAFRSISTKTVIKVPSKKLGKYQNLFKKAQTPAYVKITK